MRAVNGLVGVLNENRLLVVSGLYVGLRVAASMFANQEVHQGQLEFALHASVVGLLLLAWQYDRRQLARSLTEEELLRAAKDELRTVDVPFLLRVACGPNPLSGTNNRLKAMVKEGQYWDWTLYIPSPSEAMNRMMLQEATELYLTAPCSTSTVGVLRDAVGITDDYLIVGIVKSDSLIARTDTGEADFIPFPWDEPSTERQRLQALRVYRYRTEIDDTGSLPAVRTKRRRVYETRESASNLFESLMAAIEVTPNKYCVAFGTVDEWHNLDATQVRSKLELQLCNPKSIQLGMLDWWMSRDAPSGRGRIGMFCLTVGFLLSPLTPGNDLLVNILPSYVLAVGLLRVWPSAGWEVADVALGFYFASNVLGVLMLLVGGWLLGKRAKEHLTPRGVLAALGWGAGLWLVVAGASEFLSQWSAFQPVLDVLPW